MSGDMSPDELLEASRARELEAAGLLADVERGAPGSTRLELVQEPGELLEAAGEPDAGLAEAQNELGDAQNELSARPGTLVDELDGPRTSSELVDDAGQRAREPDIDPASAGTAPGLPGHAGDSAGDAGDSARPAGDSAGDLGPDSGLVGLDPQGSSPDGDDEALEDDLEPRTDDDEETLRRKFDLAGGRRFNPRTGEPLTYEQWRATWRSRQIRHDWSAIRARYVEGYTGPDGAHVWPSLNVVAEHFNAGVTSVHKRSSAEGWAAARSQWQQEVEAERRKARVAELVQAGEKIDSRALNAAELGIQLCVTRLVEIGRAVETRRQAAGVDYGSAVDPREMQALAAATDLWHKIGLRAVGDREALRVQLVGANGSALDIGGELTRDNPERLTGVVAVLEAAGLGEFFRQADRELDGEDVVDAEVVG